MFARRTSAVVLSLAAFSLIGAAPIKHPRDSSTCQTAGLDSFVGGTAANNAFGTAAGVLAGSNNTAGDDRSGVGAGNENTISTSGSDTAQSSFIAGGGYNSTSAPSTFIGAGFGNAITGVGTDVGSASYSSIGSGENNKIIQAESATIGSGEQNKITALNGSGTYESNGAYWSSIGGGTSNEIEALTSNGAEYAVIGGGTGNVVSGAYGWIGGGSGNHVSGIMGSIPGGYRNLAAGAYSFAGGVGADAYGAGSFVWADDAAGAPHLASTKDNQFFVRASGGVVFYSNAKQTTGVMVAPGSGTWSNASDRNLKDGLARIDDAAILSKVAALPVAEWSYISERGVRHLGPMAQDFYAAFHVGADDRHIATIDEDGVALAAIKALHSENTDLRARLARLERAVARLSSREK